MRRIAMGLMLGIVGCRPAPPPDKGAPASNPAAERDAASPSASVVPSSTDAGETEGTDQTEATSETGEGAETGDALLDADARAFVAWLDSEEPTRPEQVKESIAALEALSTKVSADAFLSAYLPWHDWLEMFCTEVEFTDAEQAWLYERKGKRPARLSRFDALLIEPYTAEGDWYYRPDERAIEKRFGDVLPQHERDWLNLVNNDPVEYGEDFILLSDVEDLPGAIAMYEEFLVAHPDHPRKELVRDTMNMHVCGLVAGISAEDEDYRKARKRFLKRHAKSEFAGFVRGLVDLEAKSGVKGSELVAYIESGSECVAYDWDL